MEVLKYFTILSEGALRDKDSLDSPHLTICSTGSCYGYAGVNTRLVTHRHNYESICGKF